MIRFPKITLALFLIASPVFGQGFKSSALGSSSGAPTSTSYAAFVSGVQFVGDNQSGFPATLYFSCDGVNFSSGSVPVGAFVVNAFNSVSATLFNWAASAPVKWTGLSVSNTQVVGQTELKTYTISYRWSTSGPLGTVPVTIPASSVTVSYSSGNSSFTIHSAGSMVANVTVGATVPVVPVPQAEAGRKEMEICIFNNSDSDILTNWGDKFLRLTPGLNHFRYDGGYDSNGLPTVRPADFMGAPVVHNGANYLVGSISKGANGGAVWGATPVVNPTAATGPQDQATIRTDTGLGVTINMTSSGGVTRTGILGTAPTQTPSNTSGSGATISDSSQPKPVPTTSNVTNNTINNVSSLTNVVTSNVTNSSTSTGSGYDGVSKSEVAANHAAANALTGDGSLTPDPEGTPEGDLPGALTSTRQTAKDLFGSWSGLLAVQTIPKDSTFVINIAVPGHASINEVLDLTKAPIPQLRGLAYLIMLMGFGLAFMKKITI